MRWNRISRWHVDARQVHGGPPGREDAVLTRPGLRCRYGSRYAEFGRLSGIHQSGHSVVQGHE
jgi:hypothetical protein